MMTIILILCLGILIVNLYFFKAVCKSNDAINLNIDKINTNLEIIRIDIKTIKGISTNIRHIENTVDFIDARTNKFNTTYSKDIAEEIKWRENVAQNFTEVYGEAVETRKAVISLNSKPQAKSKKALSKENESSK